MNSSVEEQVGTFGRQVLEALQRLDDRLAILEHLAIADIRNAAREEARKVCEIELAELRGEMGL